MSIGRKSIIAVFAAGSMLGGAAGATVFSAASSSAATSTTPAATAPADQNGAPNGPQGGVFHSNENATHEQGESAQREAQETAGHFPTVP